MKASSSLPEDPRSPDLAGIDLLTVLQALSDPVRLEIVRQLAACTESDGLTCGQIMLPVAKSTASHHLKTLHSAGVVASREEGTSKRVWLRRPELDKRFPGLVDSVLQGVEAARRELTPQPSGRAAARSPEGRSRLRPRQA